MSDLVNWFALIVGRFWFLLNYYIVTMLYIIFVPVDIRSHVQFIEVVG